MSSDHERIAEVLGRLLRERKLAIERGGWVPASHAAEMVARELEVTISADQILVVARAHVRLESQGGRIRGRHRDRTVVPPDILYHACTQHQMERYSEQGAVRLPGNRHVFLSADEAQAWRAAHRMDGVPRVLFIDTARNRRRKLRLQRSRRSGLYLARSLSISDVLNLRSGFAEQLSAGGIPIQAGPDGMPRMALIRVTRRSGVTWEVAKGKLEPGEPPEWAGVREVQEEMGIDVDFNVRSLVGLVRYGFMAPGGRPRLKTIYLYLLDPVSDMDGQFNPSTREGIGDVRWFTPREACEAVTHSSLRPLMHRARAMVG